VVAGWLEGAEGSRSGKTVWLISTRGASDMVGGAVDSGESSVERGGVWIECNVEVVCVIWRESREE
jgi:hypothetical protein